MWPVGTGMLAWLPELAGLLVLQLVVLVAVPGCQAATAGFLSDQLPLQVVQALPTELLNGSAPVTLDNNQALTVVFTRAVLALGGDFGPTPLPADKVPFTLDPATPGDLRWVTSYIARWDPPIDGWPTNLRMQLVWNTNLTTFDGLQLNTTGPDGSPLASPELQTEALTMDLSVTSERANNLTNGTWDAALGLPDDSLPEVPPDGRLTLTFNHNVSLLALQAALRIVPAASTQQASEQPSSALALTASSSSALQAARSALLQPAGSQQAAAATHTSGANGAAAVAPSAGIAGSILAVVVAPCTAKPGPPVPLLSAQSTGVAQPQLGGANSSQLYDSAGRPINDSCAMAQVVGELAVAGAYELVLPAGTRTHPLAGPLPDDLRQRFGGLRRFRIPFLQQESSGSLDLMYRRLDMWLPHGLAKGVTADSLAAAISLQRVLPGNVTEAVLFNLSQADAATLRLPAELQPGDTYRVFVTANSSLHDGFGLPLESSSTEFNMTASESLFLEPGPSRQLFLLEAGTQWGTGATADQWPIIDSGPVGSDSAFVQADALASNLSNSELGSVVSALARSYPYAAPAQPEPVDEQQLTAANSSSVSLQTLDAGRLLADSGAFTYSQCCRSYSGRQGPYDTTAVMETEVAATFLSSASNITAWVTRLAGGGPVAGARVRLFCDRDTYQSNTTAALLADGTTGSDGTVTLLRGEGCSSSSTFAAVDLEGRLLLTQGVDTPYSTQSTQLPEAALVLDRLLAKPGDPLYLKGYVRQVTPAGGLDSPSSLQGATVRIANGWHTSGAPLLVDVRLDDHFGSFNLTVTVPSDADPGEYEVGLLWLNSSSALSSTRVVVGDPRPPTAALTLQLPELAPPRQPVNISISAQSYIGAAVAKSPLTLTWTLNPGGSFKRNMSLISNNSGIATASLPLGDTPEDNLTAALTSHAASVSVEVTWIGPTRERIVESGSFRLAESEYLVEVQRSLATDLPGVEFGTWARVTSARNGSDLPGTPVTIRLLSNATAAAASNSSTSAFSGGTNSNDSSAGPLQPPQQCTASSGNVSALAACRFRLPGVGDYQLEACVLLANGTLDAGSCQRVGLGRSLAAWHAAPLAEHLNDDAQVFLDRHTYQVGDTARVHLDVPYVGAWALLQWGSYDARETRVQAVDQPGLQVFEVPVDTMCRRGCALDIAVAVPRQAPAALPSPLPPVSALFDPAAPHTITASATISVPQPAPQLEAFNVTVSPTGVTNDESAVLVRDDGGGLVEAPVVEPGAMVELVFGNLTTPVEDAAAAGSSNTTRTSGVNSSGGSGASSSGEVEVTLVVVDKAVLDQVANPLVDLSAALQPATPLLNAHTTDSLAGALVAPGALAAAVAAALRRLAADPWLPVDLQVLPDSYGRAASVDVPDAEYLAGYTYDLTVFGGRRPSFDFGSRGQVYPSPGGAILPLQLTSEVVDSATTGGVAANAASTTLTAPAARSAALVSLDGATGVGAAAGAAAAAAPAASQAAPAARVQAQFVQTPLFQVVRMRAGGAGRVRFAAPQSLGTFLVRAYGATGGPGSRFGAAQAALVVRRQLSLTPAAPRLARVGDAFQAGALLTAAPAANGSLAQPLTVSVTAAGQPGGAIQLATQGGGAAALQLAPGATQEVRFNLTAASLGAGTLNLTATGPNGAADVLQLYIPVQGLQDPVTIADSFALNPSAQLSAAAGAPATASPSRSPLIGSLDEPAGSPALAPAPGGMGGLVTFSEGLALPPALPGSSRLSITAGVGHLPAVRTATQALLAAAPVRPEDVTAYWAAAVLSASGTLSAQYNQTIPVYATVAAAPCPATSGSAPGSAPSARSAGSAASISSAVPVSTSSLSSGSASLPSNTAASTQPLPDLVALSGTLASDNASFAQGLAAASAVAASLLGCGRLTDQDLGLRFTLLSIDPASNDDQPDVGLNAWAAWTLLQQQQQPGSAYDVSAVLPLWRDATARGLVQVAETARNDTGQPLYDPLLVARAHLALGPAWRPPVCPSVNAPFCTSAQVADDLSLDRLAANLSVLSYDALAAAALAWLSPPGAPADAPTAAAALDILLGGLRVTARTAYIAAGTGSATPAGLETQALTLMALTWSGDPRSAALLEKLAANVAASANAPPGSAVFVPWLPNARALGTALIALGAYDAARGSGAPDLALRVTAGDRQLLAAAFTTPDALLAQAQLSFDDLAAANNSVGEAAGVASALPTLRFAAGGRGEATVVVALNFNPAQVFPQPLYRGLHVERFIRLADPATGAPTGDALVGVPLGSTVVVTVRVTSPDATGPLIVRVLMPGGLEPVDPNVATDAAAATTCSGPLADLAPFFPFPLCPRQLTLPSAVQLHYSQVGAGAREASFLAVAATPGRWALPPARAYLDAQPEVAGLSGAATFAVCAPPCAPSPAGSSGGGGGVGTPRGCPGGCSCAGVCDLGAGACLCDAGFGGPDCSQAAAL